MTPDRRRKISRENIKRNTVFETVIHSRKQSELK